MIDPTDPSSPGPQRHLSLNRSPCWVGATAAAATQDVPPASLARLGGRGGGGAAVGEAEPAGLRLGGGCVGGTWGVAGGTLGRRAGPSFGCGSGQSGGGETGAWVLAAGPSLVGVSGCGAGGDMAWRSGSATSSFVSATLARLASLAGGRPGEAGGLVL